MEYIEQRDNPEVHKMLASESFNCRPEEVRFVDGHIGTRYDNGDWDEVNVYSFQGRFVDIYIWASGGCQATKPYSL